MSATGKRRKKSAQSAVIEAEAEVEGASEPPSAAAEPEPAEAQDDEAEIAQTVESGEFDSPVASGEGEEGEAEADAEREPISEIAPVPGTLELDRERTKQALEALIFVSDRIVTAAQLARALKSRAAIVRELVTEIMQEYQGRGIELIEVASGYQFRSAPACAEYVREFVSQKPIRLTRAQLETLALIAYRQPITRPEIDEVRGVDSGSAMRVLLERNLIKMLGRKDEPGRPLLYGTSPYFLEFFGMRSLKDLPTLREFTELSDENRALFKRKTGENVEDAEAELAAAEEAARRDEEQNAHISDEDLAELAAEAELAEESEPASEPPPPVAASAELEPEVEPEVEAEAEAAAAADGDDDDEADLDDDEDDDDFDDDDDDFDDDDEEEG
jgi:segregation and condensation protein B